MACVAEACADEHHTHDDAEDTRVPVTVRVDTKHVVPHLDEEKPEGVENESVEQVAFADVILLNKTDLVSAEEKEAVRKQLRTINSGCKIVETQHSRMPLDEVLNVRAFDLAKTLEMDDAFLDVDGEHMHDDSVTSVGFECEGDLDPASVNAWLSTLLRERGVDIFRSKGILSLKGTDERFVFQGVHMLMSMGSSADGATRPWHADEKRQNRLVFIGRKLDRDELRASF